MISLSYKRIFKYTIVILLLIWIILSIHIFYVYLQENSIKIPFKWWTLVEWWTRNINYLPYTSINDDDKFYQSLLFKACLTPYVSWTNILLKEELCKVETTNYKNFKIYLLKNNIWSDWTPISLEDVYFTYHDIIIQNKFNLSHLNNYKKIKISLKNDYIEVEFPFPSIDNQLLFTNFILPKHVLENKNLNRYINQYPKNLINNNCWKLKLNVADPNSIIFDLTNCKNIFIKNYQYKKFKSIEEINTFNKKKKKIVVDYYINEKKIDWYTTKKIILNNYLAIFFNSKSPNIDLKFKQAFLNTINQEILTWFEYQHFVKVYDYFKLIPTNIDLKKRFDSIKKQKNIKTEKQLPNLTKQIIVEENKISEFFLEKINDKFWINFILPKSCEKVGIQANSWAIYYLKSYKKWDKVALYNISEKFWNLKVGKNTYKLYCQQNNKSIYTYTLIVYYKNKPVETKQITQIENIKIKIVYYKNYPNEEFINYLKNYLKKNNLKDYFIFESFEKEAERIGILQWWNYDIFIQWIYLWLRKDISDIFKSDNPLINPSQYKNIDFANNLQQFLISKWKTKETLQKQIEKTFNQNIPLIFIWKYLDKYQKRSTLNFEFPKRLYNRWLRKNYIQDVIIIYKPKFNLNDLFNIKNFSSFIENVLSK